MTIKKNNFNAKLIKIYTTTPQIAHFLQNFFGGECMALNNLRMCAAIDLLLLFLHKNGYFYAQFHKTVHPNASIVTSFQYFSES